MGKLHSLMRFYVGIITAFFDTLFRRRRSEPQERKEKGRCRNHGRKADARVVLAVFNLRAACLVGV